MNRWVRVVMVVSVVVLGVRPWALAGQPGAAAGTAPAASQPPAAAAKSAGDNKTPSQGVPIIYRGQEVGRVYRAYGPYSPEERARAAVERIDWLVRDDSIAPEDTRIVHFLLISAALATPGIVGEPRPFVLQTALDDFYVSYEVNAYTHDANQMQNLYSALHGNIQDTFYEAGVEIMSPHATMLRDGNKIAIPDRYQRDTYEPGAIRVRRVDQ